MNLKKKYWILSLGFVGLTLVFLGVMGVYIWQGLDPEIRGQLYESPDDLIAPLFLGGSLLLIILLFFLNEMFQSYILPLDRLMEDSRLLTTVNPEHEIKVKGCWEIMELARRLNEAAEQMRRMRDQLEHGLGERCEALEQESAHVLEIVSRLPRGVLVVNAWDQIVYFNARALAISSRLLDGDEAHYRVIGYVGLGRQVRDLFGERAAEEMRRTADASRADFPSSSGLFRFETGWFEERGIQAGYAPLNGEERGSGACMVYLEQAGDTEEESCRCATPLVCPVHDDCPTELLAPFRLDAELLWHPVPAPPLEDVPLRQLPCTVFDLETTGLDPDGGDEIVSISAVRIINGRIASEEPFHQLIQPKGPIPLESERIHGISQEMVRDRPGAETVLPSFGFYCRDTVLVSHCAEFDMLFLGQQGKSLGLELDNPVLDTMLLATAVLTSRRDQSLESTVRRMGASLHARHSSLGDALSAAEVFLRLIPLLEKQGVHTLGQAVETSRRKERCVDYSRHSGAGNLQSC